MTTNKEDAAYMKQIRGKYKEVDLYDACMKYFRVGKSHSKNCSANNMFPKGHLPPRTTIMETFKKSGLLGLKKNKGTEYEAKKMLCLYFENRKNKILNKKKCYIKIHER